MKAVASLLLVVAIVSGSVASAAPEPFPGERSDWNGFDRYDFEVDGKPVLVVTPKTPAKGRPWVWHGEFFGHKPAPDIELLKRGFHIAYMRVPDLLGAPKAVAHWDNCYRELTDKYGLSEKVALVGLSRGGLYCYNWAIANPEKVACIYGDAPVCDFKSWPGGFGEGPGSTRDWKLVLQEYAFESDEQARAYDQNPVNQLAPLAKAGVPLLHVFGDADEVVPWKENTGLLAQRYRELGGHIQLIQKVGVKHHPHGLEDPTPIVEFIEQHAALDPPPGPRQRNDPVGQLAVKLTPSREVVYKTTPQGELTLHVFEPEGWKVEDRRPCLLFVHGGGWSGGEPRRMYPFADHFSHLGCVAISLEYRLLNRKRGTTVFDCVEDGRSAVRFLRQHPATFGIDPDRIVVSGASAGGHVAVGTALFHDVNAESDPEDISATPNALALFFPVIDTSKDGYGQAKIGDRWRELSPVHQVGAGVPPTILFHGTGDTVTPYAGAEAFTKAMHEAGNTCELIPHLSGVHGYLMFVEELYRQTLRQMEEFLLHHSLLDK